MSINLKQMSYRELEKLSADVKKALANAKAREMREARKAAEKAAAQFGYSLSELAADSPAPRKKVPAKKAKSGKPRNVKRYANPDNPDQTYAGVGRKPEWLRDALAGGKTMEDFLIG